MFLFLVGLACLFPAAAYCLVLAMLHQRGRPTMVPGAWDAAGVLAALSGFLLVGGTTIVFAVHTAVRDYWLLGGPIYRLGDLYRRLDAWTYAVWGGYFVLLVGGGARLVRSRRPCTVIYHLAPAELDELLEAALARLGLPHERRGARWLVGGAGERGVVEADGSEAMRCVTLRWASAGERLREDVEAELARGLAAFPCPPSPATLWLMTAAGALFTVMLFLLVTFLMASTGRG